MLCPHWQPGEAALDNYGSSSWKHYPALNPSQDDPTCNCKTLLITGLEHWTDVLHNILLWAFMHYLPGSHNEEESKVL